MNAVLWSLRPTPAAPDLAALGKVSHTSDSASVEVKAVMHQLFIQYIEC
jgi:hypothetical protein